MRIHSKAFRRVALPALLAALAACGGDPSKGNSSSASPQDTVALLTDADKLIQDGEFEGAIKLITQGRDKVEKGSADEKELVLLEVKARADDDAEMASKVFLTFAEAHPDATTPKDFKYAVSELRTYSQFVPAIAVMDKGKKRWPDDPDMNKLLAMLIKDSENDAGAASALKGLGYASGKE